MQKLLIALMILCSSALAQNHYPRQESFVTNIVGTTCQFDFVPYCGTGCTAYDYREYGSDYTSFVLTYKCKQNPKDFIGITFYDKNDFITQNTEHIYPTVGKTVYIHNKDSYFMLNDGIKRTILHKNNNEIEKPIIETIKNDTIIDTITIEKELTVQDSMTIYWQIKADLISNLKFNIGDYISNQDTDATWYLRTAKIRGITNSNYVLEFSDYISSRVEFESSYVDSVCIKIENYNPYKIDTQAFIDKKNFINASHIGNTYILYKEQRISYEQFKRVFEFYINNAEEN